MAIPDMIAMHVTDQQGIHLAETRITCPGHRAPRIIKNARTVRILEHHRPVEPAEFAVVTAKRRHIYGLCLGRPRGDGSNSI